MDVTENLNPSLAHFDQSDDVEKLLARCYKDTSVFCRVFFPERFTRPFTDVHKLLFKIIDSDYKRVIIDAFRGFGKTTIMNIAKPAKEILFRNKNFIVPISCSATLAKQQSENLKRELQSNTMVKHFFGSVESKLFSQEIWATSYGTAIMPRGRGQQIRGLLYNSNRPDYMIFDDIEDKESVMNEITRQKTKEWFFSDAMNCVDRSAGKWTIHFIGTVLHEASLLNDLRRDKNWYNFHIELCDAEGHSQWKEYMSDEEVAELRQEYQNQGLLDLFYQEFRGISFAPGSHAFQSSYFLHYNTEDSDVTEATLAADTKLSTFIMVDPAKTTNPSSAFSAVVGISVDNTSGRVYIRDIFNEKVHPDILYDAIFSMADRLEAKHIMIEVTGLNEFITYPIKARITQLRKPYTLVELKATRKKEERAAALIPLYRTGKIWHNSTCCSVLEDQLLSYPNNRYWDVLDATAYVVKVLESSNFYLDGTDGAGYLSEEEQTLLDKLEVDVFADSAIGDEYLRYYQ